jgi:hypothetical protein
MRLTIFTAIVCILAGYVLAREAEIEANYSPATIQFQPTASYQ